MAPRWSAESVAVTSPFGEPPPFGAPPAAGLARAVGGRVWACRARSFSSVLFSSVLSAAVFLLTLGCEVVLGGAGGGGAGGWGSGKGG